jgi:hypothetical protein
LKEDNLLNKIQALNGAKPLYIISADGKTSTGKKTNRLEYLTLGLEGSISNSFTNHQ